MDDSRSINAKKCLDQAMLELGKDDPDIGRLRELFEDAHDYLVDLVDGGISAGASRGDLNQLDSAAAYTSRCIRLLASTQPREWVFSAMEQFAGHALDHLQVVLSGNVIPMARRRPQTRGGGAA
jgi:hypothetical protein